jgi:WD40 repeat protein
MCVQAAFTSFLVIRNPMFSRHLLINDLLDDFFFRSSAFTCHDQGCLSLTYAPQHQMLITGGKKGDVCLIDVRQRAIRQTFPAHHSAVKSIALDPNEEFFVTGSADGDIKVCLFIRIQPDVFDLEANAT